MSCVFGWVEEPVRFPVGSIVVKVIHEKRILAQHRHHVELHGGDRKSNLVEVVP